MAKLPVVDSTTGTMPRSRVVSYAMGDVANNVSFMMTSLFLMVYMTDIAGVPAAVAGTIYGVTKIWAGVADLLAGNTVGRRETKWGRLRPWIVWVSPFLSISLILLFSTPAGLSPTAAIVWILLFDAAFQLCYSFVNIPYGSLSAAMTQNALDRSRLASGRSIAAAATAVLLAVVLSPQFEDTTADGIRLKFTITTVVLSVIALVLYWVCFKGTREVVPRSPGKLKLATTLTMVAKNKPLIVLCLGALFLLGAAFTLSAVMVYYARDVLGSASYFVWLQLAQTVGTIASAALVPMITDRFGKRLGYVALAVVAVVGLTLVALVPTGGLLVAVGAFLVYGFGYGGTNALMFSMQADTVDYGEWTTGTRAEGGSYSILSFVRKTGQGVGGFVGGAVIAAFGYAAGAHVQSAEAIQGIKVAAGWVPAGLAVIAALVLFFYPLKADQHRAIIAELTSRRARLAALGETTAAGDAAAVAQSGELLAHRPVVTINEQYGAGASYVARRVGERLGVPYVGTRFSSEELEQAEIAEFESAASDAGPVSGFLRSFAHTAADVDASISADAQTDTELIRRNVAEVIDLVKGSGGVIVGRDATVILATMQGALHVRLQAPVRTRITRAVEALGIDRGEAAQRQEREDRMRTHMSQRLMHWDPADANRYDLVLDTSELSLDDAVDRIVAAAEVKRGQ